VVGETGCSLAQFCAAQPASASLCQVADWRNDERLGDARDCTRRDGACTAR
jgi:hypothetical protein